MMRKGFTLIELLIVMAVIAVLIGIAIPSFRGMQQQAKTAKAQGDLRVLKLAVEAYNAKHNTLPANLGVLTSETTSVVSAIPTDAFGTGSYDYAQDANSRYYALYSVGPNGTAGTVTVSTAGVITDTDADDIGTSNGTGPNSNWN